jgi:23S rRNA pseudouridine2457 synthase
VFSYYLIYKPYMVLSQFSLPPETSASTEVKKTLKDFFEVPKDVYPVGRLDYDSEGLLLLTNDTAINSRLLHPSFAHEREYWVQVEGTVTEEAIRQLRDGVQISIDGKPFRTGKAIAEKFTSPPPVPPRNPPIRFRKEIPDSWIKLVLKEGKNRQVRKMTARVGFPTLRLIRERIANLSVSGLEPGEMRHLTKQEVYQALFSEGKK